MQHLNHKRLFWIAPVCCAIISLIANFLIVESGSLGKRIKPVVKETATELNDDSENGFASVVKPFLSKYCQDCHKGEDAESGVNIDLFNSVESVAENRELWKQMIDAVNDQYMPPEEHTAIPSDAEIETLKQWYLAAVIDKDNRHRTKSSMRRLNRTEYENTIRDLFRLKSAAFDNTQQLVLNDQYFQPETGQMPQYVMAFSQYAWSHRKPPEFSGVPLLPGDPPAEHGFDNNSASLSFSPLQLESYFEVASKLLNHPEFPKSTGIWESLFVSAATTERDRIRDAEMSLRTFLPRAFRRAITEKELKLWLAYFRRQLRQHECFTNAMKSTVLAIIMSPHFLFRTETSEDQHCYDDYAVASQLSYFLWGSMPDDELFRAAALGQLQNDTEVRVQVRRMLSDRRARSLSTSFGVQWLKTTKAIAAQPDKHLFKHYHYKLGQSPPGVSMAIEQMLLFETILVENRSILEFLDADFGYVNRLLMEWYGLDPEAMIGFVPDRTDFEDFFRIKWPNKKRGGILSAGATLLSTSATDRTSPVFRGAWVLEVIYNRPPPPPPADVPALDREHQKGNKPVNIRQRLAIHRQDANCAVCHDKMDPIGFALEEFDAVGQFRSAYRDGTRVDSTGELFGQPVNGIVALKEEILNQKDLFVTGFVEHMLEYSLGRSLHVSDDAVVSGIVKTIEKKNYRFGSIIEEVALQTAFPSRDSGIQPPRRIVSRGLNRR